MKNTIRTRRFLMVLGLVMLTIAGYILTNPENSPDHAALICGVIGTGLLVSGKYASEKTVKMLENLLTGW